MFQMGLMDVLQVDREREIQAALRVRRLMQPNDGGTAPVADPLRAAERRALTPKVRASGT